MAIYFPACHQIFKVLNSAGRLLRIMESSAHVTHGWQLCRPVVRGVRPNHDFVVSLPPKVGDVFFVVVVQVSDVVGKILWSFKIFDVDD